MRTLGICAQEKYGWFTRLHAHTRTRLTACASGKEGSGQTGSARGPGILSVSMNNIKKLTARFDNNRLLTKEYYVNDDVAA